MTKAFLLGTSLLLSIGLAFANSIPAIQKMGSTPLCFTENKGQWYDDVKFRCDAGGAIIWICKDRIVYQFLRKVERADADLSSDDPSRHSRERGNPASSDFDPLEKFNHEPDSLEQLVITARFVNANPDVQVVGEGSMEYKCNYFIGNDPKEWHADVPNYQEAVLYGVYDGVDLRFFAGENGRLAYQYDLEANAGEELVRVEYEGVEQATVTEDGRVVGHSDWREITGLVVSAETVTELPELDPRGPQELAKSITIENRNSQTVQLIYSTYLGGADWDHSHGIAIGSSGSTFVTGQTYSFNFPAQNAYSSNYNGNGDAFVSKLSTNGSTLVYSTFLGGTDIDIGSGVAVDYSGSAYVTGWTGSSDFPTKNACDGSFGGGYNDGFVSKLSVPGKILVYSTYLGGIADDYSEEIAVDFLGSAYITGWTNSSDFPTQNAYDTSFNGFGDAFVAMLGPLSNPIQPTAWYVDQTWLKEHCDPDTALNGWAVGKYHNVVGISAMDVPILSFGISTQGITDSLWALTIMTRNTFAYALTRIRVYHESSNDSTFTHNDSLIGVFNMSGPFYDGWQTKLSGFYFPLTPNGIDYFHITADLWTDSLATHESQHDGLGLAVEIPTNGIELILSGPLNPGPIINPCYPQPTSGYNIILNTCEPLAFQPKLALLGSYYWEHPINHEQFVHYTIPILNHDSLPNYVFQSITHLGPCGLNPSPSRTWLRIFDQDGAYVYGFCDISDPTFLDSVGFTVPVSDAQPESVYVTLWDRECNRVYTSNMVAVSHPRECGDVTGLYRTDISDAVFIINYIFAGGFPPYPLWTGDVDCNGQVDISDAVFIINYIFGGGATPCAAC